MKVHKRCAIKVDGGCKWMTLRSLTKSFDASFSDLLQQPSTNCAMPHQWLEGNHAMSAKCAVCDRTCGSVMRLQDWQCLWCHVCVHQGCRSYYPSRCTLGEARASVLSPTVIRSVAPNGSAELAVRGDTPSFNHTTTPASTSSTLTSSCRGLPLVVFVNSKSGDIQGIRVLRQFKRLLNPLQVFDLLAGGPEFGLRLFSSFESFRVLVCGGDGTVGWVFSAIDKLKLHNKCYVGILPLGTGNDLSRVLGWGHALDDVFRLSVLLRQYERAQTGMLDRWSVLAYETPTAAAPDVVQLKRPVAVQRSSDFGPRPIAQPTREKPQDAVLARHIESSVNNHVSKILVASDDATAFRSAEVLAETVKTFLVNVGEIYRLEDDSDDESFSGGLIPFKCAFVQQKLDNLLQALHQENRKGQTEDSTDLEREHEDDSSDDVPELSPQTSERFKQRRFVQRENLMMRANSLKKAVRDIVEHAEHAIATEEQKNTDTTNATASNIGGYTTRRRSRKQRQRAAASRVAQQHIQERTVHRFFQPTPLSGVTAASSSDNTPSCHLPRDDDAPTHSSPLTDAVKVDSSTVVFGEERSPISPIEQVGQFEDAIPDTTVSPPQIALAAGGSSGASTSGVHLTTSDSASGRCSAIDGDCQ